MSVGKPIDISAVIDANKVSPFQVWILFLVGLTVIIDGFDVQAMGFIAPAIIQDWGVDKSTWVRCSGQVCSACWWVR